MSYTCPNCKKTFKEKNRGIWPFCCERCKTEDLAHWSRGDYTIPGASVDPEALSSLASAERNIESDN